MQLTNTKLFDFFEQHSKLLLSQTFVYAFILSFPAFGPVLNNIVGVESGIIIACIFLAFLIAGISIPPIKYEVSSKVFRAMIIISIIITLSFPFLSLMIQAMCVGILGWVTGRYTMYWCQLFYTTSIQTEYSKLLGTLLFISYFLLYISNIFVPSMSPYGAAIWASLYLVGCFIFLPHSNADFKFNPTQKVTSVPVRNLIVIFFVFITAGTTYANIYPILYHYKSLENYYNVLPFLFAAIAAGFIAAKKGRRVLIFYGIGFLGLAFVFNLMPSSIVTYLLIQTCLQFGWAFLDAYAWITGADYASSSNQPMILPYFVATFLAGTFFGSVLNSRLRVYLSTHTGIVSALLTYLPLFIAFFFITFLPETKKSDTDNNDNMQEVLFADLTPREKEVAQLLIGHMTNDEIAKHLFISENTIKKHARNIYKKMNVANKRELKSYVNSQMKN